MLLNSEMNIKEVKETGIHKIVHQVYKNASQLDASEVHAKAKQLVIQWKSQLKHKDSPCPPSVSGQSTNSVSTPSAASSEKGNSPKKGKILIHEFCKDGKKKAKSEKNGKKPIEEQKMPENTAKSPEATMKVREEVKSRIAKAFGDGKTELANNIENGILMNVLITIKRNLFLI